jgi:hypothetical protein
MIMKKCQIFVFLVLILSVFFSSCNLSSEKNEAVKIPLTPYLGRLVTVETILGNDTLQLLFDTGGGETLIGTHVAKKINCTPYGRKIGFRMSGEQVVFQYCRDITLVIGDVKFHHDEIGVWDIQSVLPENAPPVDGILSLKTFLNQPFTLDLSSKSIILETPNSLANRIKSMNRLTSRLATGTDGSELDVFLRGRFKKYGWFLLDSGNLDVLLVSEEFLIKDEMDSNKVSNVTQAEFQIEGLPSHSVRYRTKNIIYDGALSEEFMREYIFTFDLSSNAIWACPREDNK